MPRTIIAWELSLHIHRILYFETMTISIIHPRGVFGQGNKHLKIFKGEVDQSAATIVHQPCRKSRTNDLNQTRLT